MKINRVLAGDVAHINEALECRLESLSASGSPRFHQMQVTTEIMRAAKSVYVTDGNDAPVIVWNPSQSDLEKEGVALLTQYGFVVRMNKPLAAFLRKVGAALGWVEFQKLL